MSEDSIEQEIRKEAQVIFDKLVEQAIIEYRAKQQNLKREVIDNLEAKLKAAVLPQPHIEVRTQLPRQHKRWTEEEINILRSLYPTEEREVILAKLGRKWYSIKQKASKLNIERKEIKHQEPIQGFQNEALNRVRLFKEA